MTKLDFEIRESKEGFQVFCKSENWVTGHFQHKEWAEAYIEEKVNPPTCEKCNTRVSRESVTGIWRCPKCEPFYFQKCGVCNVMRVFCCC